MVASEPNTLCLPVWGRRQDEEMAVWTETTPDLRS